MVLIGGKLYVPRLNVGYAQMVGATIGDLVIQASNGNYYGIDVDMNGKLTIADATLIQRAAIDLVKFSQNQLYLADVNGDSRISILDVTCIQKYLAEFRDGTALAGEFAMTLI